MQICVRQLLATGTGIAMALAAAGVASAQSQAAGDNSGAAQQHNIQLVQAQAELSRTLDAKKAKQGDPVMAKLQQNVKADTQELPKNTVLEGHVDQVQASQNKGDSTMVVTFDKAKLKNGQELPIKATVIAISEPALANQQQATGGGAPEGGMSGPPSAGGPAAGGPSGGPNGGNAQPQPQPMNNAPAPDSGAQQQTQNQGVPGVTLTSDIHQHTSATFTSKGRNVHVPDGVQMEMAIAVIPPGVKLQ